MKYCLLISVLLIRLTALAQSPDLSLILKMDSIKAESTRYKIEMNICNPKKMTDRGSWFSHDTTTIDFVLLKANDIECGGYFDKGTPTLISGEEEKKFNEFEFSGQVFAWEKIFIFKISNWSSRSWHPEMYIVMPMKYKSFVTRIKLNGLEFQSGKVMFLSDYNASYTASQDVKYLNIDQSLKGYKTVDLKNFFWKELVEEK